MRDSELSASEANWGALLLVDFMLRPKDWIHRRVDTVDFDDDVSATRKVSIDFSIPNPRAALGELPEGSDSIALPVALMRKQRARVYQLQDETGQLRPVLTRPTQAYVAKSTLALLAYQVLGKSPSNDVQQELDAMATEPIHIAYKIHQRFVGSARLQPDKLAKANNETKQRARLFKHESFRIVAYTLTWSYVLIVQLPNQPKARHVLCFSYEERPSQSPKRDAIVNKWVTEEQHSTRRERLRWRMRQARRAFGRALGWSPRRFLFSCAAVVYGQSYHFEVEAPQGTQISSSALYLTTGWSPRRNPYKLGVEDAIRVLKRKDGADDWERGCLRRSHLYVRDAPDTGQGIAEIELRAQQNTFVQGTALTALLSLAILGDGLHFRPALEVDAGTALLLLLPTVLVAYVIQPGAEHEMAGRLLLAIRGFGIIVGLFLIVASGALIVAPSGQPPSLTAWRIAVAGTCFCTVVLVVAWVQARPRRYRRGSAR